MTTPSWMPPLDPGDVQDESGEMVYYSAEQVEKYMEAAVEAYRRSLKPVAWITAPHGVLRYDPEFRLKGPQSLDWRLPLYLLDDQT